MMARLLHTMHHHHRTAHILATTTSSVTLWVLPLLVQEIPRHAWVTPLGTAWTLTCSWKLQEARGAAECFGD